ncbi:Uncharacterised protein [Vibrio cholerae]|nr:Uncharacterised protein [Vibrio cholerae]CSI57210.1 Uncharacterised protein [Vibrio cholerae]
MVTHSRLRFRFRCQNRKATICGFQRGFNLF